MINSAEELNHVLDMDYEMEIDRIGIKTRDILSKTLRKRGLVVAMSGGIDSSVCAALAVKAIGPNRVFGLLMPEKDSSSNSLKLGRLLAETLGISYLTENIEDTLEAIGCYRYRDEAIRSVFPDYGPSWKNKIVISGGLSGQINRFNLVVESPDGKQMEKRIPLKEYLTIVAATNNKQRIRKTLEYFHADRLNYAVVGTPNRLEYDQGFFVKNGDGSADIKPIAHLYKTQVYKMAEFMELPDEICSAVPTTDTYSLSQGQDEFYFALPYHQMDIALWCLNHKVPAEILGKHLAIEKDKAEFVYQDILNKRKTTAYLHASPQLTEDVRELYPLDHSPG